MNDKENKLLEVSEEKGWMNKKKWNIIKLVESIDFLF